MRGPPTGLTDAWLRGARLGRRRRPGTRGPAPGRRRCPTPDRKSTRLNSSHSQISYAVFSLKKDVRWIGIDVHDHVVDFALAPPPETLDLEASRPCPTGDLLAAESLVQERLALELIE